MIQWIFACLALVLVIWFVGARYLRGADLKAFDSAQHGGAGSRRTRFTTGASMNDEHRAVITALSGIAATLKGTPRAQHVRLLRTFMDNMTADRVLVAQFAPVDAGGVRAEWVLVPGADSRRRTLYIHGSFASRMLNELATGIPMCLTVTLVDGLVLARSGFHSSVNYRSVVVLGTATVVVGDEKGAALEIISEQILPGRWADIRWPTRKELKAATVLKLRINEASAKIRTGPPKDDEEDYALKCWAGVLPLKITPGKAVADPRLPRDVPVPAYAKKWPRPRRGS